MGDKGLERERTIEGLLDDLDATEAELNHAVLVAFNHGAHNWVKLNYPHYFKELMAQELEHGKG